MGRGGEGKPNFIVSLNPLFNSSSDFLKYKIKFIREPDSFSTLPTEYQSLKQTFRLSNQLSFILIQPVIRL